MGSVAADYRHVRKLVSAGEILRLPETDLKWYDLHRADSEITDEVRTGARKFVVAEAEAGRLSTGDELGFVILHRVGDAYLLLVQTWRNENELWETVYFDNGTGFELWPFPDSHKGTFCVWELGAVMHEQQAWIRYLFSERDATARAVYLADLPEPALI